MADPDRQTPAATGGQSEAELGAARLRRLRWRARRGLLENDLVITRFLDSRESGGLAEEEILGLDILLDLTDPELLDLVLGRTEPTGEADCQAARTVLAALRAI